MNIDTTGFTYEGKTYRNLPEQVAYNAEQIAELIASTGELNTFDWTISDWILHDSETNYYYGTLHGSFKADRRYLLVVPLWNNSNSKVTQFFSINSSNSGGGTFYIWLYAYGAAPGSITFRAIDIGPNPDADATIPDITIVNHESRFKPTRYNRTLTVPGRSWTSDVNTVKFNLGELTEGYHIQLIPADVTTIDYIQNYYIAMMTPLYTYNGSDTSIIFKHNDGDYGDAPDLKFIVLMTPVSGMTKQYISLVTNGGR